MTEPLFGSRYQAEKLLANHDAVKTWRGRDSTSGEAVIIKALDVGRAGSSQEVELFERQGNVLSQMKHPRIPEVRAVLQEELDGRPTLVLVTQCVNGDNLEARIKAGLSLDERGIITLGIEVARILEFLHARLPPVIHRDVKPSNLVQDKEGTLHLVDFGSVKLPSSSGSSSRGATVVGTFGYMPPEQFEGSASPASDVHALGMTLLYLATHKHPWEHGDGGPRAAITSSLGMSAGFRTVLRRMTEPESTARYLNGQQAREALEALLSPRKRGVPLVAVAGLGLLLLGSGGVVLMLAPNEKPVPPPPPRMQTVAIPPYHPPTEKPVTQKPPIFFSQELGAAHRCFMRAVPRILQSRWRYLSWLSDGAPPTGHERYISYGLYEGYSDAMELCNLSSDTAPESMRSTVGEVAALTRDAIPLLKRASNYYEEARYKDDGAKGARELHGPLMRVFDGMLSSGMKLEGLLLTEDVKALKEAAHRHQDRPFMAKAVALLTAYHHIARLSPATFGAPFDRAALQAAVDDALDLADTLDAQKSASHEALSDGERTAVDSILGRASVYRTVARQLREGKARGRDEGRDPLQTRAPYLETVVDIHLWAEMHR